MPNATYDPEQKDDQLERINQQETSPSIPAEILERIPTMSEQEREEVKLRYRLRRPLKMSFRPKVAGPQASENSSANSNQPATTPNSYRGDEGYGSPTYDPPRQEQSTAPQPDADNRAEAREQQQPDKESGAAPSGGEHSGPDRPKTPESKQPGDTNNKAPNLQPVAKAPEIYDDDGIEPTAAGGTKAKAPGRDELNNAEENAGQSFYNRTAAETAAAAGAAAEEDDSLYNPNGEAPRGLRGRLTRRQTIFGGGLLASTVGIILFITLAAGPGQFIQLSHILERNMGDSEHTTNLRLTRLFRFARTGGFGETRVNIVGSKLFGGYIEQLKASGIEFQTTSFDQMKSVTFDTGKLQDKFPELKGMSEADQKSWLAEKFGLDEGSFVKISGLNGTKFAVNTRSFGVGATRALVNNTANVLDDGKALTALRVRAAKAYFDLPSLFHPLKRVSASASKKLALNADRAAYEQQLEEQANEFAAAEATPDEAGALRDVKGALKDSGKTALTSFLIAQAGLCTINGIADSAIALNHLAIVAPATIQAASKVGVGNQIESNQDFDSTGLGVMSDSMVDSKGGTIWQGEALQATEGLASLSATDLPHEYQQAFSGTTTADSLKKYTTIDFKALGFKVNLTGAACSKLGLAVGAFAGLAAIVGGLATWGGSTTAYVALKTAEAGATVGIIYSLERIATPLLKDKAVVPEILSGPLGGNVLAYGARELANVQARSSGGVDMAGTSTSVVSPAVAAIEQEQYNSQPVLAKLFNYKDYRSLAGRVIDNTSPSVTDNIARMGTAMLHFGNIFSGFAKILSPKALAANQPYDWGFDRYGISDSIAANPKYDDPYANADQVAKLLDSSAGNELISRAADCFGVDINKDGPNASWQVVPINGTKGNVDPHSGAYTSANCNDSTTTWQRIMLFVFDSRTMDAAACYLGDDTSCDNVDPSTASPTNSVAATTASTTTATASTGSSSYKNPMRDLTGLQINRIDQGVDYGGAGPVYAIGNGVVDSAASSGTGWPGGTFIKYHLTDGPAAGKEVFVAEDCLVKAQAGQKTTPSTVLCTMYNGQNGIETGWAGSTGTIAAAYDIYQGQPDGAATAYGKNFSDFMKSIGGPPGDITKSSSSNLIGSLPAGWPTWQ